MIDTKRTAIEQWAVACREAQQHLDAATIARVAECRDLVQRLDDERLAASQAVTR